MTFSKQKAEALLELDAQDRNVELELEITRPNLHLPPPLPNVFPIEVPILERTTPVRMPAIRPAPSPKTTKITIENDSAHNPRHACARLDYDLDGWDPEVLLHHMKAAAWKLASELSLAMAAAGEPWEVEVHYTPDPKKWRWAAVRLTPVHTSITDMPAQTALAAGVLSAFTRWI